MIDSIEEKTADNVEVEDYRVYCAQCCNGRTQIRPGGLNYSDRVPCHHCRPAAYAAAMGEIAQS